MCVGVICFHTACFFYASNDSLHVELRSENHYIEIQVREKIAVNFVPKGSRSRCFIFKAKSFFRSVLFCELLSDRHGSGL